MKTATVTEAKNGLSARLDRVKAGESVVITDRGVPVAVLEPAPGRVEIDLRLASLERRGLVRRGSDSLDLDAIVARRPTPPGEADVVRMLFDEREAGW